MFKNIKNKNWLLVSMSILITASACIGGASAEPTQDPNVIFTQVAETVMVSMTQTAEAAPPTATPEPTATMLPTLPPTATIDPNAPIATEIPTLPSAPQATQQKYGNWAEYKNQSPIDGTVFKKNEEVTFSVCWLNVGSTDWTKNFFLSFAGGTWISGMSPIKVEQTVKPGDTWCFYIAGRTPNENGTYKSIWYINDDYGRKMNEMYFYFIVSE